MEILLLFTSYVKWHYTRAVVDILHIWGNMIYFFYNLFSVKLMFTTLFSKWRRLGEERETTALDIGETASVFLVNTVMRIVGALMRFSLIIAGLISITATLVIGFAVFVLWFVMPIVIVVLISAGIYLITVK